MAVSVNPLAFESTCVWLSRQKFEEAESAYQHFLTGGRPSVIPTTTGDAAEKSPKPSKTKKEGSELVTQMENMRSKISDVLTSSPVTRKSPEVSGASIQSLQNENKELRSAIVDLKVLYAALEKRVAVLEGSGNAPKTVSCGVPNVKPPSETVPDVDADDDDDDDDDDLDLFGEGDDSEDEARRKKIKEDQIKMYQEKKNKKPALIAKSNVVLDVKPWDDETDMKKVEECVRSIAMDGLKWGASKLVPVGYGIEKLQITCVIEDDKVLVDDLEEKITAFDDYVQSMDIAAFNKV